MTNLTEDQLTRAGHDVRRAVAALPDAAPPRRRRPVGALAVAAAAALVVVTAVAVPALLRNGGRDDLAPAAPPASPPPLGNGLVAGPDVELGSLRLNSLAITGDRIVAMASRGFDPIVPLVLTAGLDGREWTVAAEAFGPDDLGPQATAGEIHLAIGASGGDGTTVYRSADRGATWAPVAVPVPAGHTQHVVQQVAGLDGGGFLAAGISTPTSFDEAFHTAVWRSTDGQTWEVAVVGAHGVEPVHARGIATVEGRAVVFAAGGTRIVAYEEQPEGGWAEHDLASVIASQGADSEGQMVNVTFVGSATVGGYLHAWWSHATLGGGEISPAAHSVTRRSAGGERWEAKAVVGPAPMAVAEIDGGMIGLAPVDPAERYAEPTGVLVVGSVAGVRWHELARYDDVWLRHLVAVEPGRIVAAGTVVGSGEPGTAIVRPLEVTGTVSELIGGEPGG